MIDMDLVAAHRGRALSPENPQLRGTAQNPDVFFQAREACNKFYDACPAIVQKTMDKFAGLFGRQYHLFDYVGAADAERVIVCMGSGSGVIEETVDYLTARGREDRPGQGPPLPALGQDRPAGGDSQERQEDRRAWIARKSRAPTASRSTRTSSRRWPRVGTVRCRRSSAAATA